MKCGHSFTILTAAATFIGFAMQTAKLLFTGYSVGYRGGSCVIWYSYDGDQINDIMIAPRSKFGADYAAATCELRVGGVNIAVGRTQKAYICDTGEWRIAALDGLKVSDIPKAVELEDFTSVGQIVNRVLGKGQR